MKFARTLLAIAGISIASAPAMAAPANTASSLSIAKSVRAGTPVARKSRLAGGGAIIAIVGAAAVIAGIVVIANDGDDSDSN